LEIILKLLNEKTIDFDLEIKRLESKIDELNQQIKELSWDDTFGMWTRAAFLQFCSIMPRGKRVVVFIDMDDIHNLNYRCGYTEIDKRIKETFSIPFRRSDLVARWYSGDEIVILFDSELAGAKHKIYELIKSAKNHNLTFKYEMCLWDVSKKPITEIIDTLSNRLAYNAKNSRSRNILVNAS